MKKQKEWHLKIPNHILDIPDLAASEQMLRRTSAASAPKAATAPSGQSRIRMSRMTEIGMDVRQKRDSDYDKNGVRPGANYHPTINNTVTENNKRTMTSPSPLPAAGQAPATLRHRSRATAEQIARFKARFGRAAGFKPLTKEEF